MTFTANYATANEQTAARAKSAISWSDYKPGTANATVRSYTDKLVDYANSLIERHPTTDPEKLDSVQSLIDRYSAALAAAIDKDNEITSRCPSVMIAGGSKFPTRKKEKQNEAAHSHWLKTHTLYEASDQNYYFKKVRLILTDSGIIKSDDPEAVKKIKAKIAALEAQPDPYGNAHAEIRRLKERLLTLAPDEMKQGKEITINGEPATYESMVRIFDSFKPVRDRYDPESGRFYLTIPLVFSDGSRKYKGCISKEVNENGTEYSTYGNAENHYQSIWKPLDERTKFLMVLHEIHGSGNKAVIYSILQDLDPERQAQKEQAASAENKQITINGEECEVIENAEQVRLQIIFAGKPEAETRNLLKSNGFRWAPSQGAWQRLLNDNARHALDRIAQ